MKDRSGQMTPKQGVMVKSDFIGRNKEKQQSNLSAFLKK
jgi:hypothetical protein